MTACATTGPITISLESLWRDAWEWAWDDIGRLASEEMPEEHEVSDFFFRGRGAVACQCFPCRAWVAYKVATSPVEKVGRNEMCPCGSFRKYKKCHGR